MGFLRSVAGVLAAVMFMFTVVSGFSYADIIIADENVDPETGFWFELLEDGTYMADCFEGTQYAGELVIPSEFNGRKVSEVRDIRNCKNITSVVISEGITKINGRLFNCESLEEIYIPSSVEEIYWDLFACNNIKNIYIDENNESICSVDGAVYSKDKTRLMIYPSGRTDKEVIVSDFVTTLNESAFCDCDNIESIIIPQGVIEIESLAFSYCDNLKTISIPSSVVEAEEMFLDCYKLEAITVDEGNENYCSVDGVLFSKDMTRLLKYPDEKNDEEYSVPTSIIDMYGIRNNHLKRLTIPDGVEFVWYANSDPLASIYGENLETVVLPGSLETFFGAITKRKNAKIEFGGTVEEWKSLVEEWESLVGEYVRKEGWSTFRIMCSDGTIADEGSLVSAKEPTSDKNSDGSYNFTAGFTEKVAEDINRLSDLEAEELKNVVENISVTAPADADFDIDIELYVTPNVSVSEDFGDRRMALDLTFKNSNGEEVQPQIPVTVRIPVPERLRYSSTIYVYHVGDDGKIEKIESVTETIGDIRYVVFETGSFSIFVLTDQLIDNKDDTSEPTSSDTSEPTSSDTSEPTSKPDSSDTSEPTSSDTSDPTSSGISEPTSSGTSKPTPSGTNKPSLPSSSSSGYFSKDVEDASTFETTIKTPKGTLIEAILTASELKNYKNGADVSVVLAVDSMKSSSPDKKIADNAINRMDYKACGYLDLKLTKEIDGEEIRVNETNNPITILFNIPSSLREDNRVFVVVRVHNGKADILNDYDDDADTVTIRTDKFSTYVLAYSDKSNVANGIQSGNSNGYNPYTGGKSHTKVYFTVGLISLLVFFVLCFFTGKNGMTEEQKERKFAKLIAWGKRGGKVRATVALAVIFLLLSFYYGIGMKTSEN